MSTPRDESLRWWRQAKRDTEIVLANYELGYFELICFLAQQAAEKALKAYLFFQEGEEIWGHSTHILAKECTECDSDFETLFPSCRKLDLYYIPTRYPNGLPDQVPYEAFGKESADEAIAAMKVVIDFIEQKLPFTI